MTHLLPPNRAATPPLFSIPFLPLFLYPPVSPRGSPRCVVFPSERVFAPTHLSFSKLLFFSDSCVCRGGFFFLFAAGSVTFFFFFFHKVLGVGEPVLPSKDSSLAALPRIFFFSVMTSTACPTFLSSWRAVQARAGRDSPFFWPAARGPP